MNYKQWCTLTVWYVSISRYRSVPGTLPKME